jgi:hypothetical protein
VTESFQKISDKIADVAQPWVQRLGCDPSLDAMQTVHLFAMAVWNARRASLTPLEEEGSIPMQQLNRLLRECLPDLSQGEVRSLMRQMIERASRYDDDPRMVLNVQLERLGESRFKVNAVAATFSRGDRK